MRTPQEVKQIVSDEHRPGYYKDRNGKWEKDRRKAPERRRGGASAFNHHDRRTLKRRKADREILERETKSQIKEALEDFGTEDKQPETRDEI